jgi:signal transduction histidine kinase
MTMPAGAWDRAIQQIDPEPRGAGQPAGSSCIRHSGRSLLKRLVPSRDAIPRVSAQTLRWPIARLSELFVLAVIVALIASVFLFDIFTPPDDVSIPFLYTIPIFLTLFSRYRIPYACAAISTALSIVGAFIQPPREIFDIVFLTNRSIAIGSQWLIAFLISMRKQAETKMMADFQAEKNKAEVGRRFIDVLSHEIGTSLTMIDGQAFRMRKLSADRDEADLGARAEKIRKAVRHVESVVRQVQLVSEVGEGAIYFRPQALSLAAIINDLLLEVAASRPITADLKLLPDVIHADADLMRQTIENLLSNAIKYSSPGSPIKILGLAESGSAVLVIADRGRGIASDEMAKLTEPYFRGRNSQGVHGAGIGLYIAKRFVASHGGSLDISSTVGLGTTVTIKIPVGPLAAEGEP